MLRKGLIIIIPIAALAWFSIDDAAAQPVLSDHRIMVSEHTGIKAISSLVNDSLRPVRVLRADVPKTVRAGEEALFVAQVNVESATLPITSSWSFGDGTKASGLSVRHTFTEPGRYVVRFGVSNRAADVDRTFEVEVRPRDGAGTT